MLSCLSVRNTLCVEFHTLTPEEAIKLGVDTVTDVREAIMTAPKIDIVRSSGADTSKDGELILGTSTNTTTTSHTEKTTTAGVWQAQSGQGSTTETANNTVINGKLNIGAGINTTVQIPEGNLKDQIAALSQQPGMGYLNDLASNPNIKWDQVKLAHDEWSYSQQGLTPAGAALLSIAVAVASGGSAAGLVQSWGFTGATAATMTAGMTALASSAAVSFVNNGGDIGKTLKDMGSTANLKNLALAMVTAGVLSELGSSYQIDGKNLNDIKVADGFQANLGKAVINNLANAGVTSALTGTSLEDNIKTGLVSAFISAGAGSAAFEIGNQTANDQVAKALAHALAGCMAGGASGGKQGCESGAIGAVVGELAAQWYDNPPNSKKPEDVLNFVKVVSAAAGAITGDGSAASVSTAVMTGVNAAQNNYLNHTQWQQLADELAQAKTDEERKEINAKYAAISQLQDAQLAGCDLLGVCAELKQKVRDGTDKMLALVAASKLPEGYAGAADLQFMGQRLSTDAGFRQQVGQSLNYMAWCSEHQSSCNQDQLNKAIALAIPVLAPLVAGSAGALAVDALVSAGRMLASEAKLLSQLGVQNYCAINPVTCVTIAETAAGVATNSNAPSVLPLNSAGKATAEAVVVKTEAEAGKTTVVKIEELFGQTFESIPLSHTAGAQDGVLGEQLSLQLLNEKTGLNFKPLQNASNYGCDGCAIAINGDTITVVVADAKSSQNGVNAAASATGDPATRLQKWLDTDSIAKSDPALAAALKKAIDDGAKVQGVTVKVGLPAPGTTGVAEFKVQAWPSK